MIRHALASVAAAALIAAAAPALALDAPKGPLVTTEWLEANAADPNLRLVEVSVDPGTFERGHIEGAQNVVWHTDLVDPVKRDIASRESFEALVERLGIDDTKTVVLYGDNNNWFAAWGAWVFDTYGIDVKLLDGGRKKWEAENRPLTTRARAVAATEVTLPERDESLRARLPRRPLGGQRRGEGRHRRHPLGRRIFRQDLRPRPARPSSRCAPATCRARSTCPGARLWRPTARSSRPTS